MSVWFEDDTDSSFWLLGVGLDITAIRIGFASFRRQLSFCVSSGFLQLLRSTSYIQKDQKHCDKAAPQLTPGLSPVLPNASLLTFSDGAEGEENGHGFR